MFIDTHAHLYDERFKPDEQEIIKRALSNSVNRIYLPNCDSSTVAEMLGLQSLP